MIEQIERAMKHKEPTFAFQLDAIRSANLKSHHCVVVKIGANYKVISYFEWLNSNKKSIYKHNPLIEA